MVIVHCNRDQIIARETDHSFKREKQLPHTKYLKKMLTLYFKCVLTVYIFQLFVINSCVVTFTQCVCCTNNLLSEITYISYVRCKCLFIYKIMKASAF